MGKILETPPLPRLTTQLEHCANKWHAVGMPPESDRPPCAQMTLKELDDAGRDVRAWCFACGRGSVVDTNIWQRFAARGWPMTLEQAASRFRCESCGSADHVALFPIERPPAPANAASLLVEGFFHGMRRKRKRGDHDIMERASARLISRWQKGKGKE